MNPYRCAACGQASFHASRNVEQLCDRCQGIARTERHITDALDVVAEPDHRRAEHMNRTLRRVEGGDEHG